MKDSIKEKLTIRSKFLIFVSLNSNGEFISQKVEFIVAVTVQQ